HFAKSGTACIPAVAPQPVIPGSDTVWVDDSLPSGASLQNGYNGPFHWDSAQSASGTQSLTNYFYGNGQTYDTSIIGLSQLLAAGENAVVYVRLNECAPPRELKIIWYTNTAHTSAYWGQALIGGENVNMGALPATGAWVRLQIPFSQLGLEGSTLQRVE